MFRVTLDFCEMGRGGVLVKLNTDGLPKSGKISVVVLKPIVCLTEIQ